MYDIREIVEEYLKVNGYDGLVNNDDECGCVIGNLVPCCGRCVECQPGYNHGKTDEFDYWMMSYPRKDESGNLSFMGEKG